MDGVFVLTASHIDVFGILSQGCRRQEGQSDTRRMLVKSACLPFFPSTEGLERGVALDVDEASLAPSKDEIL